MVSVAWKALPEDEREKWEELARQDKARYEMEKSMYTGPWKVPATKRINKDPKAPKRPMSAFLSFSNTKRSYVKNKHKDAKNAEVSRILAQMWKDADAEEKKIFVDEEFRLRQEYKLAMSEWKRQSEDEIKSKREQRENEAMKAVREGKLPLRPEDLPSKSNSISNNSPATDSMSTTSMGMKYSTKMATDTFAPSLSNPYPPHLPHPTQQQQQQSSSSSASNLPVPTYSFSNDEYIQQHNQQYPPSATASATASASSSSHYNQDQLHSSAEAYRNPYGAHPYQAASANNNMHMSMNSYDAASYDRRYDTPGIGMGYETYGQPHPYGYAPPYYYQQGTSNIFHI
jgi:hypothetical protein